MEEQRPDMNKTNNLLNQQGKKNICYDTFSTDIDESVQEIVALAGTLGLTCASNIYEENEYFYGDELTDWSKQHYKVINTNESITKLIQMTN